MNIEHVCPDTLFDSRAYGYTQVVVGTGNRTAYIGGQVSLDKDMNLIGQGDLVTQAKCTYDNIGLALKAVGGGPENIVRMTVYVVDFKAEYLEITSQARRDFFGDLPLPASATVGVTALAMPDLLIEIDAIAVLN